MKTLYFRGSILLMAFLPVFFSLNSCLKETVNLNTLVNKLDWQPSVGVPLAYGNFTLMNLISAVDSAGYIKAYSDSSLYFDYTANLYTKTASQVIILPNQAFNESFSSPNPGFPLPVGGVIQFTRSSNYTCTFNNGGVLDTINIKSGTLGFNVTSTLPDTGRIVISMPTLTKGGTPFQQTIVINNGSGNYSSISNNDISGYSLQTTVVAGTPNQVPVTYKVLLGSSSAPPASDSIKFGISLSNLTFLSIYGYLGQYSILDTAGVFKFNFFNNFSNSNIVFADPRFHLYFANSFGIPVSSTLQNVYVQSTKSQTNLNLFFNASVNPFNIPYPQNINQTAMDTLLIDSTSCANLPLALSIYPQYLFYGVSALTNPVGKPHNFVSDSSKLNINLGIELPLNLKVGKYVTIDTIKSFPLGSAIIDSGKIVKQFTLNSAFLNGMPFDLNLQIYLCDSNLNHIDTVFTNNQQPIIKSAAVNNSGKATTATQTYIPVTFNNAATIKKLINVKKAIVTTTVSTTGNGQKFVTFYSYYRLYVRFGVNASFKITNLNQL